ncbi:MAG: ABC transporter permease [Actinobacteria bacterium]|nr:ABC transporter permease [Actinomycetota bacterium]
MQQISAVFIKTVKELYRNKTTVFWTIIWPVIFLFLGIYLFYRADPLSQTPPFRAGITISMIVFSLMLSGFSTMPGMISMDRSSGLFLKLRSMPVKQWKDLLGRIFGLLFYVLISSVFICIIGIALGARFKISAENILASIAFLIVATIAAAGAGIIIGTFIKNINGAIITGVGISVISMSLSGVTFPYAFLPKILQAFSRYYPYSSSNAIISYMLSSREFVGYNPLSFTQIVFTVVSSVLIFALSVVLYARFCWKAD